MTKILEKSLGKIAKGAGVVFLGTMAGMFLAFIIRVVIVRYITLEEYGLYSLALVLSSLFTTVSILGLEEGSTRYIAYFRSRNKMRNVENTICSSLLITVITGLVSFITLFFFSDIISEKIFHCPRLTLPLKIFSASIPFGVLISIFTSFFRGFDDVKPRVYFQEIIRNVLFILLLILVISLHLPYLGVFYSYLISIVTVCVLFGLYALRKLPCSPINKSCLNIAGLTTGKKLLFFSFPLLGATMLNMLMNWTDTLMIGFFETPDVVGLYNGALPLARLILLALTSAGFIYVPIISGLYSMKLISEIKKTYQILGKWVYSVTLPLFFIFFLFPETVLGNLFGPEYSTAGLVLRLLSLGFMFHVFLGLNGLSLMVLGEPYFLLLTSFIGGLGNIILNYILIPPYGIMGAAIASLLSYAMVNILNSIKLYQLAGIHPFTKSYIKTCGISLILILISYALQITYHFNFWMLIPLTGAFIVVYAIALYLTGSYDEEDRIMLLSIKKRIV